MNLTGRLILLLLCLTQGPAWAQPEPLGRLFFTPQQRAALDRQRQLNLSALDNEPGQTLNGEVRRSSGRSTRWINGEPNWDGSPPKPRVPVGDTYYPGTGVRESLLGSGKIIVKPGSRGP